MTREIQRPDWVALMYTAFLGIMYSVDYKLQDTRGLQAMWIVIPHLRPAIFHGLISTLL